MNSHELCKSLHNGQRVYGTLIVSTSPKWCDSVKRLGLDFVFIDTKHVPIDRAQLSWMCKTYEALGLVPIVRIPSPDPFQACMVLDAGARGIIAPYIESPQQVRRLSGAVKYKPLKGKKLESFLFDGEDLEPDLMRSLNKANSGNLLIVNIESCPAMEALDDILSVRDLDAILIGPHDLTHSLGIPEQYNSPIYKEAVEEIIQKARAKNIGAGIHVCYPNGVPHSIEFTQMGANFIVHNADFIAFEDTIKQEIHTIKKAFGDLTEGMKETIADV